ncbi:MAG: type II toxin-antitoxin system prevent-host-death family antitoxin [Chloroflexi bacterium]|nr:type II toxin-antitoxin system prevent-host-death family antitoxin [Chloroflexota bacterium]MCY3587998.1 type II toxin-antitoxin system prevent-host-death family antitoxin [Chloroflexota bacterium]MCY3685688.1 type II toxin-antitoxin system prevent-host-death family antitoxin [Chloroflexota bacterium]MDE2708590.1 type II toxin-antitoxin system prevent-host-death family antitoxin [Chloroflexota bacterium]
MRVVNMHEAKTHLSRLVRDAENGQPFIIARSGTPLVKVVPLETGDSAPRRIGFLRGISVPDDFDRMGDEEIGNMFGGQS